MTTLRAVCPHCATDVELRPEQITLHLPTAPAGQRASSYAFVCPDCDALAVKPADARTVELLLLGEVNVDSGQSAPWELFGGNPDGYAALAAAVFGDREHPEHPPAGPTLTMDDLLTLHELLQEDDWFDRLAGSGVPEDTVPSAASDDLDSVDDRWAA